jgi:DNA-binding transcriptional regulator YiaG
MENHENGTGHNPVLAVRKATGDTQPEFAKRLGVGLRSLKRYELEDTLPRNMSVMRTLRSLAKKHGIEIEETAGAA